MKERKDKNNPDIIYNMYTVDNDNIDVPSREQVSRSELVEHISFVIDCYYEDCIYFEDDENLYFYLDFTNLNCAYIGYEEAAKSFSTYCRIPLVDLVNETEEDYYGNPTPDNRKIRKFVREYVPTKLLKKR